MTLDLKGKRVVVTGGKHPVERAIAEAVAQEGADVVIWNGETQILLVTRVTRRRRLRVRLSLKVLGIK